MCALIKIAPLTKEAFAPFGEVIETSGSEHFTINQGSTERYHNLAKLDLGSVGGKPVISMFEGQPLPQPIKLKVMERHPLGSQAFYPLQNQEWIIVVASGDDPLDPKNISAFRANGIQGVNYARNIWHHPLLVLARNNRFLIIDRAGPGENLEERAFKTIVELSL